VQTIAWGQLQVCVRTHLTLYTQPLEMELIQGSETSANSNLTPGKYPEEKYTIFKSRRKSEIKNTVRCLQ